MFARTREPTCSSTPPITTSARTGKDYQDWPISDVHYHYMHDMLSRDALMLGIAYRMTGREIYAQHAAEILRMYADKYKDYQIVDNYGKQSNTGARHLFADAERIHLADRHDVRV
jgi:hypothetical protein